MSDRNEWHLDKKVPITFIAALVIQTIVVTSYLATMRSDIDNNTLEIARNAVELDKHENDLRSLRQLDSQQAVLLGKIEVELKNISNSLNVLKDRLDGPIGR